jgi:murein DD-endopeptidase MepM/ murein hydrolase activator NlpD
MNAHRARITLCVLALLACATGLASGRTMPLALPAQVKQGALVVGQAAPDAQIWLGERRLRVDAAGRFVFGVGRDQTTPLQLRWRQSDGSTDSVAISVERREWRTERVDGVPQATVTPPPAIAERIAREQATVAAARLRDDDRSDFLPPFSWPTRGRISGVFGSQRVYNGEPRAPHSGLDVAAASGTPLRAPAAGVVSLAESDLYLTGGTVLLDHGHGVSSVFLHLSRIDVAVGQRIEQGDVFGAVGATGRASGPHMHWGLNWFDVRLDPALLEGIDERHRPGAP